MRTLFSDLRYALRQLRRSPGFAFLAVLTLAMAIGANVIVFGVINALILHPLPVPESNRLLNIQGKNPSDFTVSYPNYQEIRDRNQTFSAVAVVRPARVGLDTNGIAEPVWGLEVSGNYFQMLGVAPALGRFFYSAGRHQNERRTVCRHYLRLLADALQRRSEGHRQGRPHQ